MKRKEFEARLHPEMLMMWKFIKRNPKITLEQTVERLLRAEAKLKLQEPVVREAVKRAKSESLYFTDEDGASHRVRPSPLKQAVTRMLKRENSG